MNMFFKLCIVAAFLCLTSNGLNSQSFNDWKSVIGNWEFTTEKGIFSEEWKSENDSTFSGIGTYRLTNGDTVMSESLKIVQTKGETYYIAQVNDQNEGKEVWFKLTFREDSQWYFENKSHDFPQGISYSLNSPNLLNAWIEGKKNGNINRQFFYFKRMALTGKE
ncbi:MAG: DUF6265 family protein [Bacteroidia bacterium]